MYIIEKSINFFGGRLGITPEYKTFYNNGKTKITKVVEWTCQEGSFYDIESTRCIDFRI